MILDERTEFCDAALLNTGAAGTYNLGDVIDIGAAARDIGTGADLFLVIQVDTGIAAGSAGTVRFDLVSDAQDPFLTNGTQSIHYSTPAFVTGTGTGTTTLRAGVTLAVIALPMEGVAYERYLGIQQVTGTAAITAGRINAFLTPDPSRWRAYADAIN